MTTDIYWEQCVIMTKKSSILLPSLDLLILRIAESGLPDFWENEVGDYNSTSTTTILELIFIQVSMLYSDAKVQQAVKYYAHHHEKEVIRLEMKHLEGAFAVLVIGSLLSFICFILEIVFHVCSMKNLPFRLQRINERIDRIEETVIMTVRPSSTQRSNSELVVAFFLSEWQYRNRVFTQSSYGYQSIVILYYIQPQITQSIYTYF